MNRVWRRAQVAMTGCVLAATAGLAMAASASAATNLGQVGLGSVVVDDGGQHVFVSAPKANAIDEFDFSGHLVATVPNIYGAWGMVISGNDLYVAESTAGAIVRLDVTQLSATPATVATGLNQPTHLASAGGDLWTTVDGSQWASVESVDPSSGATAMLAGSYYDPDLAVGSAAPDTLFVSEDGLSPGAVYSFDVSTPSSPTEIAHASSTDQENIEDLAVSADGTRVIPASGWPYLFEELDGSTLAPDGIRYPGNPYPSAVAVSAAGLVATGVDNGYSSPDISVYRLGAPTAIWSAATNCSGATANVLPHGLALSADGNRLFAVTTDSGQDTIFSAFTLTASAPAPTGCISPPQTTPTQSPTRSSSSQPSAAPSPSQPSTAQPTQPPHIQIVPRAPRRGRPDVYVELGAFRVELISLATHRVMGYRYYFTAQKMRCINGATDLIVTVQSTRRIERCTSRLIIVSPKVTPHKRYRVGVQAVKMRRRKIVKRGASYTGTMYMPGNEARWTLVSSVPPGA